MAKEINMKQLRHLVMEEVAQVEKDLEKVKATEVDPDGYADTLDHKIDWESKLGIKPSVKGGDAMLEALQSKERKAVRLVRALRLKRAALISEMNQSKISNENRRLREAIKKVKSKK